MSGYANNLCHQTLLEDQMGGSPHGLVRIHMETMSTRKARWVDLHIDLLESIWKPCPQGILESQLQPGDLNMDLKSISKPCRPGCNSGWVDLNMNLLKSIIKP
jgi:hypothetical protein